MVQSNLQRAGPVAVPDVRTSLVDDAHAAAPTSNSANTNADRMPRACGKRLPYKLTDAKCATAGRETATAGHLEIISVDTSIRGVASMSFPTGRVIANFDALLCAATGATAGGSACTSLPLCPAGQGADLNPAPTETCIQFK